MRVGARRLGVGTSVLPDRVHGCDPNRRHRPRTRSRRRHRCRDGRIGAAGPRLSVAIPNNATIVDSKGQWIVPGFVDTNVHPSLYGGVNDRYETLVRYAHRQREIALEAAQLQLASGVTTVRDSYGMLGPLVAVRDDIAAGRAIGSRILAAGNIVGWGGPYSISFSLIPETMLVCSLAQDIPYSMVLYHRVG